MIALNKYRLIEKSASLHNYTDLLCLLFRKGGVKQNTLVEPCVKQKETYEGWNFNSGNYLFTTDTK